MRASVTFDESMCHVKRATCATTCKLNTACGLRLVRCAPWVVRACATKVWWCVRVKAAGTEQARDEEGFAEAAQLGASVLCANRVL